MKNGAGDANAIRFEDKKGEEQLWFHAQKDQLTEVENNETKWVGADRTKNVDGNEVNTIGKNRIESVTLNEIIKIAENRTRAVKGDDSLVVGGVKSDAVSSVYQMEAGLAIRLVCGESVLELLADGQVNITCKNINFTADKHAEINTPNGILDLNMEGGGPVAEASPDNKKSIDAAVQQIFKE